MEVFSNYLVQPAHIKDAEPETNKRKWNLIIPSRIVNYFVDHLLCTNTKH